MRRLYRCAFVRLIGVLLAFVLALALLRLVVIAVCAAIVLILVWAAIMRPRQGMAFIFFGVIGAVAEAYPAITLGLLAIVTIAYLLGKQ